MFGVNLHALFRRDDTHADDGYARPEFRDAAVDRLVRLTNPRLRLVDRYRERLGPAAEIACRFAHGIAQSLPETLDADPAAWSSNDSLRAFFVGGEEVSEVYGRSSELRKLFRKEPAIDFAYSMLAMRLTEQKVFGMAIESGQVRRDVPQTTLSFSHHRVRVCSGSESALRDGVAWQVIDQLALRTLARLTQIEDRRHELEIDRALLAARLRMLGRQGTGFDGGDATGPDVARLEAELDTNARQLAEVGGGTTALDRTIEVLRDVLGAPETVVRCAARGVNLTAMNVVLDPPAEEPHLEIRFVETHLDGDPPLRVALMPTRFPRAALPRDMPSMAEKGRNLL